MSEIVRILLRFLHVADMELWSAAMADMADIELMAALVADIEEGFLYITVLLEDRDVLKFLWYSKAPLSPDAIPNMDE